jgi:hypothetical protein
MRDMGWMFSALTVMVLFGMYLYWSASRVDRLHARVAAADAALDAHLVRRAVAAVALAEAIQLGSLMQAAQVALDEPTQDRELAENDLTQQLRRVIDDPDNPAFAPVIAANRRVALARQVHTDVVSDALRARRRFVVRLLGLSRRHPVPRYFDIEDPALDGLGSRRDDRAGNQNETPAKSHVKDWSAEVA